MKFFKSIYFFAGIFLCFSFSTIFSSNLFIRNLTGYKILVEVRRIPWGLLFPFSNKTFSVEQKGAMEAQAYRLGHINITIPDVPNAKIVSTRHDRRIFDECMRFQQYQRKEPCYASGQWIYVLRGQAKDGKLEINQGPFEHNFLPIVLVATLDKDNNILLTRLAAGAGFGGTKPGKFYDYLAGVDLPSWENWATLHPELKGSY